MKKIVLYLLLVIAISPIVCNAKAEKATDYFLNLDDPSLVYDGTEDNNLRFVGESVNNYIEFEGEKWRIIGVMNDTSSETNKKEPLLKIVKTDIDDSYAEASGYIDDNATPKNNWENLNISKFLSNTKYANSKLIENVYWHNNSITGHSNYFDEISLKTLYENEHSFSDTHPIVFSKIATIYPSDIAFTYKNIDNIFTGSWVQIDTYLWTMNYYDDYGVTVYYLSKTETVNYEDNNSYILPTVYLKPNVYINDGDGSIDNPYQITLEKQQSVTLKINDNGVDISSIFSNIDKNANVQWRIKDDSIVKIVDNKIIPLKVGQTTLIAEYENNVYNIEVTVNDNKSNSIINPNTGYNMYLMFITLILIVSSILIITYKKKKNN